MLLLRVEQDRWFRSGIMIASAPFFGACTSPDVPPHADLERPSVSREDASDTTRGDDLDASLLSPIDAGGGERTMDAPAEPATTDADAPDADPVEDAAPVCGDGRVNRDDEVCDGNDLQGLDCRDLGFADGSLRCDACTWDVRDCRADESCFDARDNDADGLIDCLDDDCEERCSSSCEEVADVRELWEFSVGGPHLLRGSTLGHADDIATSCALSAGGSEVVYRYVPGVTGVVSLRLESAALLSLAVRTQCDAAEVDASADGGSSSLAAELACVPATRRLDLTIEEGRALYLVVDGRRTEDAGLYSLFIEERTITCGDARRDAGEDCDDGNLRSGDGCSQRCALEATEVEPNDELDEATPYSNPFFAEISPSGDVDWIALELESNVDVLVLSTLAVGDGACAAGLMDTVLNVFDESGDPIGSDDDGGDGFCASLTLGDLRAGTYFVSVQALAGSSPSEFPYRLSVVSSVCGDGVREIGEECDDGNRSSGDGCSARCRIE